MGFGLGAAIGAKTGRPDKTVINIAGDGCFRMNMNELATAARFNTHVIEVVINNHVLGMVRQWQTLFYGKRYSNTVLNDNVDFVKVSEGLGATAIRVKTVEEFTKALKTAIKGKGPYVIDCQIESDDKVWPMVAPGASIETCFDSEDALKKLNSKISEVEKMPTELINIIDPSLIGGVKVVINDHIYDGSIKNQLEINQKRKWVYSNF